MGVNISPVIRYYPYRYPVLLPGKDKLTVYLSNELCCHAYHESGWIEDTADEQMNADAKLHEQLYPLNHYHHYHATRVRTQTPEYIQHGQWS